MLKKILAVLVGIVAAILVVAAFQPAQYRVTRSATVSAPPAAVFAQVNDFHRWEAWSPWARLDPAVKNSFEGSTAGTGAIFAWAGNSEVGEGRMTITESHPNDRIRIKLDFVKPFASSADTEFTFQPEGNQTTVTWSMSGRKAFVCKVVTLFVSMDKMLGGQFEKGLAQMKTVAEAAR